MLDIHLYGLYRQLAPDRKATANSVIKIPFVEGETVRELLLRIGVTNPNGTGDIFVNHLLADLNHIIPNDGSRVGVFQRGMTINMAFWFPISPRKA